MHQPGFAALMAFGALPSVFLRAKAIRRSQLQ